MATGRTNSEEHSSFHSGHSSGSHSHTGLGKHLALGASKLASDSYAVLFAYFQFPGALPVKQVLYARDTLRAKWRRASVVYTRRKVAGGLCGDQVTPQQNELKGPLDYDYYVHWEGMDRRLDCWVSFENIRFLAESIPEGDTLELVDDQHSDDDHAGMDVEYLREHEENTKVKTINRVHIGQHMVDTWYFSPFPRELQNLDVAYVCEWCLMFFRYDTELIRHSSRCSVHHPPGNEIYRDSEQSVAMWEIDGSLSRVYCENLCYLSKLFLDHKTLRHPVHLFLFYTLTEISARGYHIVGYFSKEKYSKNNVSCILTLPQHQRKGYGKLLIRFSYALSQREGKRGTPERPLSDLGKASYMSFWTNELLDLIREKRDISIDELATITSIEPNDIVMCLETIGVLRTHACGVNYLYLPDHLYKALLKNAGKPSPPVNFERLHWEPYDRHLAAYEYNPNG